MGDETKLKPKEHYELLAYVSGFHQNLWRKFVALIGEKSNRNKALDKKLKLALIGHTRYRLKFTMHIVLDTEELLLFKINLLKGKLHGILIANKLQRSDQLEQRTRKVINGSLFLT